MIRDHLTLDIGLSDGDEAGSQAAHYRLSTNITIHVIERLVGRRLMFHACGLSGDDGRVLVLVAPSGTGKTTAARALAASVFGYVSDETVVIDDDLRVEAYPKPLSLLGEQGHEAEKVQRGPDELGLRACATTLRIGPTVVLDRQPGCVPPRLEPVGLVDAMLDLIPQTSGLPSLPRPLQRLAEAIDAGGGARRLTYSEISDAAPLLVDLMAEPIAASPHVWETLEAQSPAVPLRDGRTAVEPFQDALAVEDELLLLVGGVPMRLAGIGATIWIAVRSGVESEQLLSHVTATHGEHPDAAELVSQAVAQLEAAGAIARRIPQTLTDVMAGRSADTASPIA